VCILVHVSNYFCLSRPNNNRITASTDMSVKKGDVVSFIQIGYRKKLYKITKVRQDLKWSNIVHKRESIKVVI